MTLLEIESGLLQALAIAVVGLLLVAIGLRVFGLFREARLEETLGSMLECLKRIEEVLAEGRDTSGRESSKAGSAGAVAAATGGQSRMSGSQAGGAGQGSGGYLSQGAAGAGAATGVLSSHGSGATIQARSVAAGEGPGAGTRVLGVEQRELLSNYNSLVQEMTSERLSEFTEKWGPIGMEGNSAETLTRSDSGLLWLVPGREAGAQFAYILPGEKMIRKWSTMKGNEGAGLREYLGSLYEIRAGEKLQVERAAVTMDQQSFSDLTLGILYGS